MSARVEQAKWAVILMMRENPPGDMRLDDERRIDLDRLDFDLALGAFSRAVSRGDVDQRFTAVEALVWLCDRRAISPLLRGLRDPAWHVRHAAARGLNLFQPLPDWAVSPLCAAITDPEPAVRVEVAQALGHLPSAASIPPLVVGLNDRSRAVRFAAIQALSELGSAGITDAGAAERLAHLLEQEDDPYVAYEAYWALGWQGGAAMEERRAAFRWSAWGGEVWLAVKKG